MEKTVRVLEDLTATDSQLRGDAPLTDSLVKALKKRRAALRHAIPESFLAAYDALGRMGRRPAVVEVRNSHCGGCFLRLPPQLFSAIRHRQSLRACPHCGRLLYLPLPAKSENASAAAPEPDRKAVKSGSSRKRAGRSSGRPSAAERRPSLARSERPRL
jgi:hypothetical protein